MMAHALLGPSGASRWMICTKSAKFSESCEDNFSVYADEGTAAHEYADIMLRVMLGGNDGADVEEALAFTKENEYYCGEMEESVELYVQIISERLAEAR